MPSITGIHPSSFSPRSGCAAIGARHRGGRQNDGAVPSPVDIVVDQPQLAGYAAGAIAKIETMPQPGTELCRSGGFARQAVGAIEDGFGDRLHGQSTGLRPVARVKMETAAFGPCRHLAGCRAQSVPSGIEKDTHPATISRGILRGASGSRCGAGAGSSMPETCRVGGGASRARCTSGPLPQRRSPPSPERTAS